MKLQTKILLFAVLMGQLANAQTKVVLKLDDIAANNSSCNALEVMDHLVQQNIKASYGVIANAVDSTARSTLRSYLDARDEKGEKLIEIWHHGLDHSKDIDSVGNFEFKHSPYTFQKAQFETADKRVLRCLGVQMSAFGAPYNATDSVTMRVVAENPNYTVFMFSKVEVSFPVAFVLLNNNVPMERETGKPDFDYFLEHYHKHPEYHHTYLVLQGHPPYWDEQGFGEFKKILDFLQRQKGVFVLPSELGEMLLGSVKN